VTNNGNAGVLSLVQGLNQEYGLSIATQHISGATHPDGYRAKGEQTASESTAIADYMRSHDVGLIVTLGYMKKIVGGLLDEYGWQPDMTSPFLARMINTHPGLLPATRGEYGIHVQELVLDERHEFAGQTLHVVGAGYDTGPTLAEHQFRVPPGLSPQQLFNQVQGVEKHNIGTDINSFLHSQQAAMAA
jgi:folate-dependent phosphoribosylglycinamide formyltransferase PurN